MKHVKLFEQKEEQMLISEDADFFYLPTSANRGMRATWVLKLGEAIWKKVEHLFDEQGRPEDPTVIRIIGEGTPWSLHSQKYTTQGREMHRIYGVSGSYTFGNAPTFYSVQYSGNKRAAREVFDKFIDQHIIDIKLLPEWIKSKKTLDEFKHEHRGYIAKKKFGFE